MRMSEKCHNNKHNDNSDNPLTSSCTNEGNYIFYPISCPVIYVF